MCPNAGIMFECRFECGCDGNEDETGCVLGNGFCENGDVVAGLPLHVKWDWLEEADEEEANDGRFDVLKCEVWVWFWIGAADVLEAGFDIGSDEDWLSDPKKSFGKFLLSTYVEWLTISVLTLFGCVDEGGSADVGYVAFEFDNE
jgi:hypothetical protein